MAGAATPQAAPTVRFEKPPATKNKGMTCNSQVASCSAGIEVRAFAPMMWPSWTTTVLGVRQDRSDQRAETANLLLHRQG